MSAITPTATNDIFAGGADASECATNFQADVADLYNLLFLWEGIMSLVPVINWFRPIWVAILKGQMNVTYAQLLCYREKGGNSLAAGEAEMAWEKF